MGSRLPKRDGDDCTCTSRFSSTGWELQTTETVIEASSTPLVGMVGSRTVVRGIAVSAANVRIGENGIAGGATCVLMGLAYPVRDVEVSQIHMIRGRGIKCELFPLKVSI